MRASLVFLLLLLGLIGTCTSVHAVQSNEIEGNAVVGLASPNGSTNVGVFGREADFHDQSNGDGIYCIRIPKGSAPRYQITYKAEGYWGQITAVVYENNVDPRKLPAVSLRKQNRAQALQMSTRELDDRLATQLKMWKATNSDDFRDSIRQDLVVLRDELRAGIVPNEESRVRAMIESTLDQMKR